MATPNRQTLSGVERPAGYLLMAVWFGLLTGIVEVLFLAAEKYLLHKMIRFNPDFLWMVPLANLFFFSMVGIGFFLAARWTPRLVSLRLAAFSFAFLGFLSQLLRLHPRLNKYAGLLLAAGLAVQTARFLAAHPDGFHLLLHRTLVKIVAVLLGLAIIVNGWHAFKQRNALAALQPAPADAPNVLLIVLDTVRASNLTLYGYSRPTTPKLERLAKTGVVFERAFSTAPWTLPSHGSMFTGRFRHELSTHWLTPLDDTYPTLAEVLSSHGYLTAGFVANTIYAASHNGLARGFVRYEDSLIFPGEILMSSSLGRVRFVESYQLWRKRAVDVNRHFLQWLSHKGQRPFFAFLNYYDAHEPYTPPQPFDAKFGPRKPHRTFANALLGLVRPFPDNSEKQTLPAEDVQAMLDAYDGAIAYLDYHLGLLFDELKKRRLLENTLVIITSDHGEQFGEHGLFEHGNSLYRPLLHVPLIVSFPPRLPAGLRIQEPVSLRDLPATITDLLRLKDNSTFPGVSLARHWNGSHNPERSEADPVLSEVSAGIRQPEWYPISKGDMKSLIIGNYHYIRNGDGGEELYDVKNDPAEKDNLIHSNGSPQSVELFRKSLKSILQGSQPRG